MAQYCRPPCLTVANVPPPQMQMVCRHALHCVTLQSTVSPVMEKQVYATRHSQEALDSRAAHQCPYSNVLCGSTKVLQVACNAYVYSAHTDQCCQHRDYDLMFNQIKCLMRLSTPVIKLTDVTPKAISKEDQYRMRFVVVEHNKQQVCLEC